MTRLAGKTALITGGGTGIGRACALLFAREGAKVALAGRRAEPLAAIASEIRNSGGEALAVTCDVAKSADVERAVRSAVTRFGRLDIVVNSAGALLVATAEETSETDWDRLLAINLKGTFLVSRAALPELRKAGKGSVVNIGSVLGIVGMKKRAAYAPSKGGVVLLTKAMALDHAPEGIRINCICPALVETELVSELFSTAPDPQAARHARHRADPARPVGAAGGRGPVGAIPGLG